ncbi:hypothetical protein QS416_12820 [Staphylococcus pseudintermedius]|uniref:hypothetical protein n=1 Tax=Staphylococcus pseudintermedius TaxID=283734 RepID=UPI00286DD7C1|nr:hypothetical protein [Staphylococcus pseudintermedius]WMZ64549.1 hypothetical protein QS416_12820 [Staphylococcus pseudintermedius]
MIKVLLDEVKGAVTVPDYPTDGDQPTITIDDPNQLPDGSQEGTTDVTTSVVPSCEPSGN